MFGTSLKPFVSIIHSVLSTIRFYSGLRHGQSGKVSFPSKGTPFILIIIFLIHLHSIHSKVLAFTKGGLQALLSLPIPNIVIILQLVYSTYA